MMEINTHFNTRGSQFAFTANNSIRCLLGFDSLVTHEGYSPSSKPLDILSFDKINLETKIVY